MILSISLVGIPRSMTQVRLTLPYGCSMHSMKSARVVLSLVFRESLHRPWQAVLVNYQGADHLDSIAALVPAVAERALPRIGRDAFEIVLVRSNRLRRSGTRTGSISARWDS